MPSQIATIPSGVCRPSRPGQIYAPPACPSYIFQSPQASSTSLNVPSNFYTTTSSDSIVCGASTIDFNRLVSTLHSGLLSPVDDFAYSRTPTPLSSVSPHSPLNTDLSSSPPEISPMMDTSLPSPLLQPDRLNNSSQWPFANPGSGLDAQMSPAQSAPNKVGLRPRQASNSSNADYYRPSAPVFQQGDDAGVSISLSCPDFALASFDDPAHMVSQHNFPFLPRVPLAAPSAASQSLFATQPTASSQLPFSASPTASQLALEPIMNGFSRLAPLPMLPDQQDSLSAIDISSQLVDSPSHFALACQQDVRVQSNHMVTAAAQPSRPEHTMTNTTPIPARPQGPQSTQPGHVPHDQAGGRRPRDQEDLVYSCTYHGCPMRFQTTAELQSHKRVQHQRTSNARKIGDDAMDLAADDYASGPTETQWGTHHCGRLNPYTGTPCNAAFSRPYDLTRHEDTIHNPEKLKSACWICQGKTFSRRDALTRHFKNHHPNILEPGKAAAAAARPRLSGGIRRPQLKGQSTSRLT